MIKTLVKKTLLFSAIVLLNCSSKQDCPQGINLLPMYGDAKKCAAQIESDNQFLSECDMQLKSRKEAAEKYVEKAWGYFYANDLDTSMKRFNQAWLLDKENAEIYWSFGNLMGMRQEFLKSIPLFEKSIQLNSGNSKVYESISTSYSQLYFATKKAAYLDLTIKNIKSHQARARKRALL